MNIVTLTLNPAFDIHCDCEDFKAYSENLLYIKSKDAGGKGVNISRALTYSGIDNKAIVVLGDENREEFLGRLIKDSISIDEITTPGRIRENITLHSKSTPETRMSFPGFSCNNSLIDKVLEKLSDVDMADTVFVFAGRIPDGIDKEYVKTFLKGLANRGVKVCIDCKSFAKEDIFEIKPWLIKPNEEELLIYCDNNSDDLDAIVKTASRINRMGIENVLISLGGKGAIFVSKDGIFEALAPKIQVVSTIGAGDSMIAGFIFGKKRGLTAEETLKYAIAFGSAACLTEGTNPPDMNEILDLTKKVKINKIG